MNRSHRLRFIEEPTPPEGTPGAVDGFTPEQQAKIAAIAAENKARGERAAKAAAEQALAEKLGGKTLDELLAAAAAADAAQQAQMTEAQKALAAANAAKAEAEKIRTEAATELHDVRRRSALLAAGAPEDAVDLIVVPDVTVESTVEEIKTAVEALKTKLPALFTATPGVTADPGKGPDGQRPPAPVGAGGLAEFERRFPKTA